MLHLTSTTKFRYTYIYIHALKNPWEYNQQICKTLHRTSPRSRGWKNPHVLLTKKIARSQIYHAKNISQPRVRCGKRFRGSIVVMQPIFAPEIHGFSEAAGRMVLDFLLDHQFCSWQRLNKMARRANRCNSWNLGISWFAAICIKKWLLFVGRLLR